MARPFIDAAVLLGAHGHSAAPARPFRKGPAMSTDVRFALLPRLDAAAKPVVFPDLNALARRIQRERGTQALDMNEIEDLELRDHPNATIGVEIWTLNDGNDRDRFIGFAWLDGAGRETLASALRRNRLVIEEAADQAAAA